MLHQLVTSVADQLMNVLVLVVFKVNYFDELTFAINMSILLMTQTKIILFEPIYHSTPILLRVRFISRHILAS